MVPMNFLRGTGKSADYLVTGSWSKKAMEEAGTQGQVRAAWTGKAENFNRIPGQSQLQLDPQAAYVYFCSNETIHGIQFATEPDAGGAPLVCDASSDFLCRPLNIEKYGILFACAQKNAGPAGVTIVIIRDDLVQKSPGDLPSMLNYRVMAEGKSLLNTPPVFAVYMVKLVTDWLLNTVGGLEKMREINRRKAQMLYEVIDRGGGFYDGHAEPGSRSIMNVTFRLPNATVEEEFFKEAKQHGLAELKGHRSVGGCRASIYNAMPEEGVRVLRDFMVDFQKKHA
jgi:phosphoserine aminotransferase